MKIHPARLLERKYLQDGGSTIDTYLYRFEYDNLNRMTKSYDPANNVSLFTYDARNLVMVEDANGHKVFSAFESVENGPNKERWESRYEGVTFHRFFRTVHGFVSHGEGTVFKFALAAWVLGRPNSFIDAILTIAHKPAAESRPR